MKHLKLFESNDELNVGDQIILLYADPVDIQHGFKNNEIYIISEVDLNRLHRYKLEFEWPNQTWVKKTQIRKATPLDINVNKYNL